MSDWPDFSKDPKGWKRGFDATMRGIFEGIAETSRKMDEVEKMRHEQEAAWGWRPRPRHLHLVPPLEEDDDG
jgi:hypothetical protein